MGLYLNESGVLTPIAGRGDLTAIRSEMSYLGAKNFVPYPYHTNSETINGITWTVNSDGSVTANGTATALSIFDTINTEFYGKFSLDEGDYILSDDLTASDYNNAYTAITLQYSDGTVEYNHADTSIGKNEFSMPDKSQIKNFYLGLVIKSGATVSDLIFKPMVRLASDPDNTYVPYAMTNQQMTPYVQAISNPNLLDNPWFTVNQRGQTTYTANGYTVDRWKKQSGTGTITVTSNGITIEPTVSGSMLLFRQQLDGDLLIPNILGKQVTLSIMLSNGKVYSTTGMLPDTLTSSFVYRCFVRPDGDSINTFVLQLKTGDCSIQYYNEGSVIPSNIITVRAIKLEVGSVSTLAMDAAPNYQQELAKCQRYFLRISARNASDWMFFCMVWSNKHMNYIISTPVEMRSIPTASISNIANFIICKGASTNSRKTGISINCFEKTSTSLTGTIEVSETDLDIGDMYVIKAGSANDYVDFSADL